MKNLNYLMDHILCQAIKIILNIHKKNLNNKENSITFKIKTGHYLKLLTPKTMELLESTKSKITKHENGENVPQLKITEVVLIH